MAELLLIGSLKVLCLLTATAVLAIMLRRVAARTRAVIWQTALIGALLIPIAATVLPPIAMPIPELFVRTQVDELVVVHEPAVHRHPTAANTFPTQTRTDAVESAIALDWSGVAIAFWLLGGALVLAPCVIGLIRVRGVLRRAATVTDRWRDDLRPCFKKCAVKRNVAVLESDEIQAPATVGLVRPVILVPSDSLAWSRSQRRAVLLHELIHISRFDWPMRIMARISCAIYWFNPLSWWAVRRLDLEQEKACDEEVLELGTSSATYAEHLLNIARTVNRQSRPALAGLTMAHQTHLEERIMSILGSKKSPRSRFATVIPAFICTAAMVPAIAAVYPADPPPRPASPQLQEALDEMRELERLHEPELERIHEVEALIEAEVDKIHDIEVDIDREAIAEIEERMRPYLERIEEIEIDMEPFLEQVEQLTERLDSMVIHVDDGTFKDVQKQIQHQIQTHMAQIEDMHINLEPYLKQIENVHVDMEHLHLAMENIHVNMEPNLKEIEKLHESLEPFHVQMEEIHESLEPLHEQMEVIGERIELAIVADVASALRVHLDAVTTFGAPFDEAAERLVEIGRLRIHDNAVELNVSRREAKKILADLFSEHRVGMQDAFDQAIAQAADDVSDLRIEAK